VKLSFGQPAGLSFSRCTRLSAGVSQVVGSIRLASHVIHSKPSWWSMLKADLIYPCPSPGSPMVRHWDVRVLHPFICCVSRYLHMPKAAVTVLSNVYKHIDNKSTQEKHSLNTSETQTHDIRNMLPKLGAWTAYQERRMTLEYQVQHEYKCQQDGRGRFSVWSCMRMCA
jgi:hypothetical protein